MGASVRPVHSAAMPRLLPARCRPDSIAEFRAAAERRFEEGAVLEHGGHRTGAIHLWGYAAEMVLKAAFFELDGFPMRRTITRRDRRRAEQRAAQFGLAPARGPHDVRMWAELLVAERLRRGRRYRRSGFGVEVVRRAARVAAVWAVELRYHPNRAYEFEVRRMRADVGWIFIRRQIL